MSLRQGNLENTILNALWYMEENDQYNIDVSEVQNKINSNKQSWAYTTVKTVLDRLVEKGLVERTKQGKKYFYQSKVSRIAESEKAIQNLAKQYFNNDLDELLNAVKKVCDKAAVLVR